MLEKKCAKCGTTITATYQSHLKRKKYCWDCGLIISGEKRRNRVNKSCIVCGSEFWVKSSHADKRECCSRKCKDKKHKEKISGEKHPRWKGKPKYILGSGSKYEVVFINESRIYKHRYLMEQSLGRKLKRNEVVHHINGNGKDNRIENLKLMTMSEHTKLHYQY